MTADGADKAGKAVSQSVRHTTSPHISPYLPTSPHISPHLLARRTAVTHAHTHPSCPCYTPPGTEDGPRARTHAARDWLGSRHQAGKAKGKAKGAKGGEGAGGGAAAGGGTAAPAAVADADEVATTSLARLRKVQALDASSALASAEAEAAAGGGGEANGGGGGGANGGGGGGGGAEGGIDWGGEEGTEAAEGGAGGGAESGGGVDWAIEVDAGGGGGGGGGVDWGIEAGEGGAGGAGGAEVDWTVEAGGFEIELAGGGDAGGGGGGGGEPTLFETFEVEAPHDSAAACLDGRPTPPCRVPHMAGTCPQALRDALLEDLRPTDPVPKPNELKYRRCAMSCSTTCTSSMAS